MDFLIIRFPRQSSYLKAYTQYVTHYQPVLRQLKNRHSLFSILSSSSLPLSPPFAFLFIVLLRKR